MKLFTKFSLTTLLILLFLFTAESKAQLGNSNMTLLANVNQHYTTTQYSACWGYKAPNGREYAILGCPTGTAFIDITDSANIHEVDFQTGMTSSWREMKVYSHYAYIVSEATGSGLQIVDLQYLPDSVHFVRTFTFTGYNRTHSISQSGPYLYMNGGNYGNGGVFILDLTTDPELPVKRGEWETEYVHDCRVLNDTIWACNIYNPPGTISVISAMNKNSLQTVASWVNNPNPFPHNCAITTNRRYILTTDETSSPNGKLKVWDISSLSNVQYITAWQPTGITTAIVHNVEIYGNYAVIAHYSAGVRVVNITNPAAPVEAAWYDTYPGNNNNNFSGCWGVFMFPSGKIIASDRQTGLYVLKTTFNITGTENNSTTAKSFELKQNYPNPFNPSTTIRYSVPKSGYLSLKVYDVTGKLVATLADGYETAGNHLVNYDASGLASGVYIYSLNTDGFKESKKMILTK
jgi:choice-of-anchor B domain-containing protein